MAGNGGTAGTSREIRGSIDSRRRKRLPCEDDGRWSRADRARACSTLGEASCRATASVHRGVSGESTGIRKCIERSRCVELGMREFVLDIGVRGIRLGVPNDQRRFRVSLDSEARRLVVDSESEASNTAAVASISESFMTPNCCPSISHRSSIRDIRGLT